METWYRCGFCGNKTRFDVVKEQRLKAFHHYTVGGELAVEDEVVLSETVINVSCRWCGHGRNVEIIEQIGGGEATEPEGLDSG